MDLEQIEQHKLPARVTAMLGQLHGCLPGEVQERIQSGELKELVDDHQEMMKMVKLARTRQLSRIASNPGGRKKKAHVADEDYSDSSNSF